VETLCISLAQFSLALPAAPSQRELRRLRQLVRFRNGVVNLAASQDEPVVRQPVELERELPSTGYDYIPLTLCTHDQVQAANELLALLFPDSEMREYIRDLVASYFLPRAINFCSKQQLKLMLPLLPHSDYEDSDEEEEEEPEALWGRLLPVSLHDHVLCGPSDSGKSTFLRLIKLLHGERAHTVVRCKLNASLFGLGRRHHRVLCVTDVESSVVHAAGCWRALPCALDPAVPRQSPAELRERMLALRPVFAAQAMERLRRLFIGRSAAAAAHPPQRVTAATAALFRSFGEVVVAHDDDDATNVDPEDATPPQQRLQQQSSPPPPPPILLIVAAAVAGTVMAVHVGTCKDRTVSVAAGAAVATCALAIALHMTGMCWFK
jgi:energy-coupling factor transporter ATP-binding protein EcfA2